VGFRNKRQAKKLPDLIEALQFLRTAVATLGASGKLTEEQMRGGFETVGPMLDKMIDEANAYLAEYQAEGDIDDPGFRDWFDHAQAFWATGMDSMSIARRKIRADA
jgi:hypothetical protein